MTLKTLLTRLPAASRLALVALPLIFAMPAEAKRRPKVPPPLVAPAAPVAPLLSTAGVTDDAMAGVKRFHAQRGPNPLWLSGAVPSAAAQSLLARLKTAHLDGYGSGAVVAARIESALATPAATPRLIGEADRLMSGAFVMLVRQLTGPVPGLDYADPAALPTPAAPEALLTLFAQGGEPALQASLRRSQMFEALRAATLADAAMRGGVSDPRLLANLARARAIPGRGRAVVVNPAAAEMLMIEDGVVVDRMRAVIGTIETPTAPLASMIHYVTANPYWNVPEDLVRKIVAPHVVRQGVGYLKRARYEPVDVFGPEAVVLPVASIDWKAVLAGTREVRLRQLPGPYNSMGRMKFGFANNFGIFLHDTPNKPQFGRANRSTSNGCVRLEDAPRLARWLLGSVPLASGTAGDQHLRLPTSVPIVIAYLTAQPAAGTVTYLADVYRLDPAAVLPAALPAPAAATTVTVSGLR